MRITDEARLGETLKLPAIRRFVKDRPFAWVDDDIGHDALEWAEKRGHALLIEVPPHRGLSEGDVEKLLEFATSVTQGMSGSRRYFPRD